MHTFLHLFTQLFIRLISFLEQTFLHFTQLSRHSMVLGTVTDLTRSKADLIAENALLRQQLIVLHRQVNKPVFSQSDRLWLVLLASRVKKWKDALLIFKPTPSSVGIARVRPVKPASPAWAIFLKNHAKDIWACDFLPIIDIWFRPLYLFFIVELASRRIVHFGVTRSPTDAWVAQQLREATPFGQAPRLLIRDRDPKYGETFTRVAVGTSSEVLKTPYRPPRPMRSVNGSWAVYGDAHACLDHSLGMGKSHWYRVIREYIQFFNQARPHQEIGQNIPEGTPSEGKVEGKGKIIAFPVLKGLHHDYQRAA